MDRNTNLEAFGYKQELKRSMSVRDLIIFGIAFMGPVSCLNLFGILAQISRGHNFLSYLLGFIAVMFTANSYGKMADAYPMAGSTFSYTQRSISPKFGFIAGWTILLSYVFLPMLILLITGLFANQLIPQIPYAVWVIAFLILITVINIIGVNIVANINLAITGLMITAILAFLIAAVRYIIVGNSSLLSLQPIYNSATFAFPAVISGSVIAVSSFLGFDGMTTMTEEVNTTDSKKIGKAIMIACTSMAIIYLLVSYFANRIAPDFTTYNPPETIFFNIAYTVGGSFLRIFITLVILLSGITTTLASQASASRILFGMGRDKLIPNKLFGYIHPKFKTPVFNILIMGSICLAGVFILKMAVLTEMITFGALIGFICVNMSVIAHYFIKNKSRNILHILFPVLGIIFCIVTLVGMSIVAKFVGVSWLLVGVIYLIIRSRVSPGYKDLLKLNDFQEQ